jgi:predicted MFS family arabinose efflux permease
MGIYNVGMALGGTLGLCLGALLAPKIGWRNVFWLAGAPSILLALGSAFVGAPERLERPTKLPAWAYLLKPTYLLALAGGVTATFGASALIFWTRWLVIETRHLSVTVGSVYMLGVGLVCGVGGVIAGGYAGDRLSRRAVGGHSLAIGLSMLLAVPVGTAALFTEPKVLFMILTAVAAFLLSVYNGPSAAVVDELGPPQFSATLQAVFLFGIHVLGNATAPKVVGFIYDRRPLPVALMSAVVAFGISGVLFCVVARRQRLEAERGSSAA